MSSGNHFIVEIDENESMSKICRRLKNTLDISEDDIEVLDQSRLNIEDDIVFLNVSEDLHNLKGVRRVLSVFWSDTTDHVSAKLYRSSREGLEKVDEVKARYYAIDSPYQGNSFLPAYFLQEHGFKMFDKYPFQEKKIDYEDLYELSEEQKNSKCPYCGSKDVEINGWNSKCENCCFEKPAEWFIRSSHYSGLAEFSGHEPPKGTEFYEGNAFVDIEMFKDN